jgi:hypothetical protein
METNTKARAAALARALTIIVSACGGAAAYTTTSIPEGATSEADATLAAIRAAAEEGELDALAVLALSSDTMFTASFGQSFSDPSELASFWATFQDPTVPEVVIGLLDAGYARTFAANEDGSQVGINVTPAVMGEDAPEADRTRLELVSGEVSSWYADGMYRGWRTGVDDNGAWRFLVIGD